MLSPELLDTIAADREREIQQSLRMRALLRRSRGRVRPLTGIARVLRGAIRAGSRR